MKKLILTIVLAALCLFWGNVSQAQTIKITGVITDQQGQTLSDATIQIVNQNIKTKSNIDGTFTISSPIQSVKLKVSYLGYHDKEISFNGSSLNRLSIVLEMINDVLKEVEINAGYYTVKDRERTGSISRVSDKEIEKQPVNNVLSAITGRVPGVEITQTTGIPGGGFNVRIRGRNSIVNGNDPLYILDGVPLPSGSLANNISTGIIPFANPLSALNTSDIQSVEILKDADATSIYGSRGANGVVLITTKKGSPGKLKIDANLSQGLGKVSSKIKLLNTSEYLTMRKEAFLNDGVEEGFEDYDINGTWDQNRYTDWQKELIGGTANISKAQISLSAGNKNTTYLLSTTYYKEGTVFPGDKNYQKKTSFLNLNHKSDDRRFNFYISASYNLEDSKLPINDLTRYITLPPNAPSTRDSSGKLNWENLTFVDNPLVYLYQKYEAKTNTISANSTISYLVLPKLEFSTRIGYTKMQRNEISTFPTSIYDPLFGLTSNDRSAAYVDNWAQNLNIEPQLSLTSTIGAGKLTSMLGGTVQQSTVHKQLVRGTGYASDGLLENIAAASTLRASDSVHSLYRYLSIYARLNYSIYDKYFINATGRIDGSSRFGKENKYADFGAIGFAWIISDENLVADKFRFISFAKLRGSYGITGNDQIGDYNYLELWGPTTNAYNGVAGLYPLRLQNPSFAWETNKKFELSLEFKFFKDKLALNSTYYTNKSSNQLVQYVLAPSVGFSSILANLPAKIQNSGLEFELANNNINKSNFTWVTTINLSFPKNKLLAFPKLESSTYRNQYVVGESLNILKSWQYLGVNPITGLYTFTDFDENGTISSPNDNKVIKSIGQRYSGGIANNLSFKNFELDFLFQFVNQTGRNYRSVIGIAPGGMSNQPIEVLSRWQAEGDITDIQKFTISSGTSIYGGARNSADYTVSDASFIRLKSASLSYNFSGKILSKLHAKTAKLSLQGQNLFTLTDYLGLDPESMSFNSLPSLRVMMLNLQVSF